MVQSTGEPQDAVASTHNAQSMSRDAAAQNEEVEHNGPNYKTARTNTQPPSKSALIAANIQSTNTSYDEDPLLSITKPTSAPNNTPVQSPPGSPLKSLAGAAAATSSESQSTATNTATTTTAVPIPSSSLLASSQRLSPGRPREVFCDDDNGGKQPPRLTRVKSEGARDHVDKLVRGSRGSVGTDGKDDNSPLSIINRRRIFSTSDSRFSSSSQQVAGPPNVERAYPTFDDDGESDSDHGNCNGKIVQRDDGVYDNHVKGLDGQDRKSDDCGMAPHSFYFDKDRSITDPNVKHDQTDEKINISSWLKSKQGAEVYALTDSASGSVKGDSNKSDDIVKNRTGSSSRQGSKDSDQFSINSGLISPQVPRSALSMGSSCGRVMSRDSNTEELSNKSPTKRRFSSQNIEDEENYVPPPPPRFINSKLDDVRSRLLVNPRVATPKIDEDIGTATAAAVLSNMRSSPFHFSERPQQYGSSRPGSSSFSSKTYPRPIIRIHHKEQSFNESNDSAIFDGNDEDEEDEEDHEEGYEKENLDDTSNASGEKLRKGTKSESIKREVTWNKNGKRINRRLAAAESRKKKLKKTTSNGRTNRNARSKASNNDEDEQSVNRTDDDDRDDSYTLNDIHDDEEEDYDSSAKSESKSQRQKAAMGSRSRTGCWICRLRKKKCTEERPHCFNCKRLNLECHYDVIKPDFVSDPQKKNLKLEEIKKKTKEAKRNAMRKKPSRSNS